MKSRITAVSILLFSFLSFLLGIRIIMQGTGGAGKGLSFVREKEKVAVIKVYGPIYVPDETSLLTGTKGSDRILDELKWVLKDPAVKAVVLRFNSPGGSVGAVQEIFQEIDKAKAKGIKFVASFGDVAASGAYYLAADCDWIVANPGSLTGSIGVLMGFPSLEKILDKWGIDMEIIKSGQYKDMGSMFRRLSPEEKGLLTNLVMDVYEQFVDAVSQGRKMPREKVLELAKGQIFTGRIARELGLVDELGNINTALDAAKRLSGIEGEAGIIKPRASSWEEFIMLFRGMEEKYGHIIELL